MITYWHAVNTACCFRMHISGFRLQGCPLPRSVLLSQGETDDEGLPAFRGEGYEKLSISGKLYGEYGASGNSVAAGQQKMAYFTRLYRTGKERER